jgi:hypothetical protein
MLKPIIINQSDLDWEGWDDPDIAAKSPGSLETSYHG